MVALEVSKSVPSGNNLADEEETPVSVTVSLVSNK
jgi:hypothetical protein